MADETRIMTQGAAALLDALPAAAKHDRRGSAVPAAGTLDALVARLDAEFASAPLTQMFGAGRLARRRELAAQTKCIVFLLDKMRCAVRMGNVAEILTPAPVTPIPNVPPWLLGVSNLRGEIVSIIDLRSFLALAPRPLDLDRRVVVVRSLEEELSTGWLVDRVEGIRGLPLDRAVAPTGGLPDRLAPFVEGVLSLDAGSFAVLDVERLLRSPEMRRFEPV